MPMPSAVSCDGLQASVDWVAETLAAVVVIGAAVPETEPSPAVTTCWTPACVLTENVTLAAPSAPVVLVGGEKLPPFVLDQCTVRPAFATGLPFASASCATSVWLEPAGRV